MIKRLLSIICLMTGWALPLLAAAPNALAPAVLETAQPQTVSAGTGLQDEDIYYAPEESGDVSGQMGASQGAVGSLPGSASYVSHATIVPFEWGHPERPLNDVELFLNNQYLGKSPLGLDNFVVQRSTLSLTAHKEGYEEAERAQVQVPAQGVLRIAVLNENAASWYTTPAWLVGLGLIVGSVVAYSGGSGSTGIGLAAGGVGVISFSQLGARWVHMPALRREVSEYNQHLEPAP